MPTVNHRKKNPFNTVHGNSLSKIPKEWTITPAEVHLKYPTSTTRYSTDKRHITVGTDLTGKLNHYVVGNGSIKVYPFKAITYPDKTPIK